MMSVEFYNNNSKEFFDSTVNADMTELYDEFLKHVKHGGKILDAGCGSGRDTLYFTKNGYNVLAFDASEEMVRLSSEYTGKQILKMRLQELNFQDEFDGVWACASLLHVGKSEIDDVLMRVIASLKVDGILFMSFKYGEGETIKGDRLFNSYNEESLRILLDRYEEIETMKIWKTKDVRPDRADEFWISALCRKILKKTSKV
jgi:2-polyprenyl-3-methyl-5-hydroxy-6-metoxy-1,4-benzoquinol methylase